MLFRRSPLDPLPQLRPPRPSAVLRIGLVAVLLCFAAAALYAEPPPTTASAPAASADPSAGVDLPADLVGVPVRLAEPVAVATIRPGDRVDLLTLPGGAAVARAALVLAAATEAEIPVLLLALTEDEAHVVLLAGSEARFGILVRSR